MSTMGESHILRNVSFAVEPGQVACLMGRNGVGNDNLKSDYGTVACSGAVG